MSRSSGARTRTKTLANLGASSEAYLVVVKNSEGDHLYLVESSLLAGLFMRLMTYCARGPIDPPEVVGYANVTLRPYVSPPSMHVRIRYFVEPRQFNDDKVGTIWSLLDLQSAMALHQDWMSDPQYSAKPEEGKANYFKNSVDHFKQLAEERWSRQQR
jgi:hypothetical protein